MKIDSATMNDSATMKQWVDMDLEGELEAPLLVRLEELLRADPEARAERRALESLSRRIEDDRISVEPGFAVRVMSALPAVWWERRRARRGLPSWALPLAMMLALASGAAWILGGAEDAGRWTGLGLTLLDFAQVTFLAGAGLLFATWRGVGFGLEQLLAESGLNLLAMVTAVVCLNLLVLSMLRRRARAATPAAGLDRTASADPPDGHG